MPSMKVHQLSFKVVVSTHLKKKDVMVKVEIFQTWQVEHDILYILLKEFVEHHFQPTCQTTSLLESLETTSTLSVSFDSTTTPSPAIKIRWP